MADHLHIEIVAPDERVFRGEAQAIRAPGTQGSFQVLPQHAPMIAALGVGPLFVTTAEGERVTYATSGGFLEVLDDRVTVLAETVEPATDIDVDRARHAEQRARRLLESREEEVDQVRAEEALDRARNRVRIAMGQVGTPS